MKEKIRLWNAEVQMAKYENDKKSADEIKEFIEKLAEDKEKLAEDGVEVSIEEIVVDGYVTRYKVTTVIKDGEVEKEEITYIEIPQNVVVAEGEEPEEPTTISFSLLGTIYTVEEGTTLGAWIAEQNLTGIWEINGYYYQSDTKIEDSFWKVSHEPQDTPTFLVYAKEKQTSYADKYAEESYVIEKGDRFEWDSMGWTHWVGQPSTY